MVEVIEARARAVIRYPGNMKPATVERIATRLDAAAHILRFVERHGDGLRPLIAYLRDKQAVARGTLLANPSDAEAAALLSHPAVREVVAVFPDAGIAEIRPFSGDRYTNPDGALPADSTEEETI